MKGFVQLGIVFFMLLTLWAVPYATADTLTYTYDEAGRLTRADYKTGSITYTYDDAGNLLKQRTQKRRRSRGSSSAEEVKTEPEVEGEALEAPLPR